MERREGYLIIDDYKKILADKDKRQYWVYINEEEYYFKTTSSEEYAYNELIAYHAAMLLGIDCCYYDLASLNGKKGVISKSLRKPEQKLIPGEEILGDYLVSSIQNDSETITAIEVMISLGLDNITADMLKEDYFSSKTKYDGADFINTLEVLCIALRERYGNNIDDVMEQIIKMLIFDILFNHLDRHSGNYAFIEKTDDIKLAPLFDNGYILETIGGAFNLSVNFYDQEENCRKVLASFLETYPHNYFVMFLQMFDTLITHFYQIIAATEKQIGEELPQSYKDSLFGSFKRNIDIIKKTIRDYTSTSTKIIGVSKKKYKIKTVPQNPNRKSLFNNVR